MPDIASVTISARIDLSGVERQLRGLDRLGASAGRDVSRGFADGLDTGMRSMSGAVNSAVTGIFAGAAAYASSAFINAFQSAVQAGVGAVASAISTSAEFQRLGNTLNFVAGGAAEGARQMEFVRATVERLSLPLQAATEGYTKLATATRGTALEGEKTQQIYTGVTTAASALGLSSENVAGTIKALTDMISKGTVSAEELRGQLGDRIPGAMGLMARALGVTEAQLNKLMEQGLVPASVAVPLLARQMEKEFGGAIPGAMNSMAAATTRVSNALTQMQLDFGNAIEPAVMAALTAVESILTNINIDYEELNRLAQDFSNYLRDNPQIITEISVGINELVNQGLKFAVETAQSLAKHIKENPSAIKEMTSEMAEFGKGLVDAVKLVRDVYNFFDGIGNKLTEIAQIGTDTINSLKASLGLQPGQSLLSAFVPGYEVAEDLATNGAARGKAGDVTDTARGTVGVQSSTFFADVRNACAAAMREIFKRAGLDVGVTGAAWDTGRGSGQNMANSFFGSDVSTKIEKDKLQPGDMVAYDRNGDGIIDHVAMFIGGGRAVGTSSSQGKIVTHGLENSGYGQVMYGARPKSYGTAASTTSTVSGTDIAALRRAIIGKESGGNYSAVNPDSGAIGIGQVMPANVPSWTEKHYGRRLTPEEFRNNREAQDKVVDGQIREAYNRALRVTDNPEIARRRAAAEWYSGRPELYNSTSRQTNYGGKYPTINAYTQDVNRRYQQEIGSNTTTNTTSSNITPNAQPAVIRDALAEQQRKKDEKAAKDAKKKIDDAKRAKDKADREALQARQLADRNADASKAQQRRDAKDVFDLETRRGKMGKEGTDLDVYEKERTNLAEINTLLQQREDLMTARDRKVREGTTGGVDFSQAIKNIDTQIAATKELGAAELGAMRDANTRAEQSARNHQAYEYQAQRQAFIEGLQEKARARASEQNYRNYDYLQREQALIARTNEMKYESIERASAEIQRQADYQQRAVRLGEVLQENWNKVHSLEIAVIEGLGGSFKSAIADLITGTKSFGDVALNLIADIGNKLASLALDSIFGSKGGGGLLGGIFNSIMPALTGGSAMGSLANFGSFTDAVNLVNIPSFATGGLMSKDGLANLHAGERVLNPQQTKDYDRSNNVGGNVEINITVHNDSNAGAMSDDQATKMARQISNIIDSRLIQQKKPGGLLYR